MLAGIETKKKQVLFTISDADYAPMSLTMFESVRKHYSDADLFLFVIGTGTTNKIDPDINVIYIHDVIDELDLKQRLAYYLAVESATSFRPDCFELLFSRGYERAVYLDPDLYFFRRMTEVDELFDSGKINGVITPHALKSISDQTFTGDRTFLQTGIYNMGFLALKNSPESLRLLAWWRGKLKWSCIIDWAKGLFVDQKWVDFLPSFFDGIHILRSPTYNLAPWNSEHYELLSNEKGEFFIDTFDAPVTFIHFSGILRSKDHFLHMLKAYSFYLERLKKHRLVKLPFVNYALRCKKDNLFLDRICTFLYKEHVGRSGDVKSDPFSEGAFVEFLHSHDGQTGLPVYIQALFEVLPDIFKQVLDSRESIDYDNVIRFMNWSFDYDGVASLETIIQLRNNSVPASRRFRLVNATSGSIDPYVANTESAYQSAVLSLPLTQERAKKNKREVVFKDNRIEIVSGRSRICLPHIGEAGEILGADQIKSGRFTEVWVPNASSADLLKGKFGIENVWIVPRPIKRPLFKLQDTGLPDNKFVVLMRHDFNVSFVDQDPVSSIRAFQRAFGNGENARLVCVALNSECAEQYGALSDAFAGDDRLSLVRAAADDDRYYSYLHRAHCILSLHQKMDSGCALAEAMSLGKYVVASAAGDNATFMNAENSFLVGGVSSATRVSSASKVLVAIYNELELVDNRKKKARQAIQKKLSPNSIGWLMQERLEELAQTSRNPFVAFYLKQKRKLHRSIQKRMRKMPDRKYRHQAAAVSQIWFRRMNRPPILE